jgi:hypothetical protein
LTATGFLFAPLKFLDDSKEFLRIIRLSICGHFTVRDIIYHFKVYLMRRLFFYSEPEDRQKFLAEARHFFNASLKNLIQELNEDDHDLVKAMPRNFHFYQRCIGEEAPRSILLSEFFKFKASKNSFQRKMHKENLSFLFGALNWDKSSHFGGLGLISDQTPTNIGYLMLFLVFQKDFLSVGRTILEEEFRDYCREMLGVLHKKFPIFEVPKKINSSAKFTLSNAFIDILNEVKDKDELAKQTEIIELTRCIFNTIIHFKQSKH